MSAQKEKADELVSLILGVIRSMHSRLNKQHQVDFSKISPLKVQVLGFIKKQKNPLMKDVADFLLITPPSATSLINSMVKEKLIIRRPDDTDRRIVHLRITLKGNKILCQGFKEITNHMKEVFACLTEKERKQLSNIYRKINNFNNKK